MKVDTITAPAVWASALVNDDRSGLSDEDERALDDWLKDALGEGWYVVDVASDENGESEEPRFSLVYDYFGGTAQCGNVLDYVIHGPDDERVRV